MPDEGFQRIWSASKIFRPHRQFAKKASFVHARSENQCIWRHAGKTIFYSALFHFFFKFKDLKQFRVLYDKTLWKLIITVHPTSNRHMFYRDILWLDGNDVAIFTLEKQNSYLYIQTNAVSITDLEQWSRAMESHRCPRCTYTCTYVTFGAVTCNSTAWCKTHRLGTMTDLLYNTSFPLFFEDWTTYNPEFHICSWFSFASKLL